MGRVSKTCKEQIRSRVPLEELLREYDVQLSPSGRRMKALCPFHAEKTPSFVVNIEQQTYYCFGCHEHGDLFGFVQRFHNLDFRQAMELLARRAGVVLDDVPAGSHSSRQDSVVGLYDVLGDAAEYYHRFLLEDPAARPAREYLHERGIERSSWDRFQLGYSPQEWDACLKFAAGKGFSPELLERVGLVRKREHGGGYYDYFRGRIMFPIADPQGRTIGFGARTLGDDVPKYLNSPKTRLFDKSRVLYGLNHARRGIQREKKVAIVEGYTDAIVAHQAGLDYFAANLGTAFTADNARRLGRLAPSVVLIFDGDAAGQRASERSLDLLVSEDLDVRVCVLPAGKDPCDSVIELGAEEFRRRLEKDSMSIFEFKWKVTMESADTREAGAALRARALDEFLALLGRVPNIVGRKLQMREFAEKIGVSEEDLQARMRQMSRRSGGVRWKNAHSKGDEAPGSRYHREIEGGPSAGGQDRSKQGEGIVGVGVEVGRGESPRTFTKQLELEELVLECVLALPEKAGQILEQVPSDLLQSPTMSRLVQRIKGQLEGEGFAPSRLLRECDESEEAQLVLRLLGRQHDERGEPTVDYEEVWIRLERDLWRHGKQKRLEELKMLLKSSTAKEGPENPDSLRREYFGLLKELRKGG